VDHQHPFYLVLLQPLRWRWLCDSPRTGCARRTKIYMRGASKQ